MPVEFSKVWDNQNNCYVYTLKKNGDKGKVGMLKFFDRDNDGLDANDGFTAKNSSIFSEEELQKNVLSRYRNYSPTVTTTVNGKEVDLPEVEYTEDGSTINIKEGKEYNLGTLAKVLNKDYSGNKALTQKNQNQSQNPYTMNNITSPYQNPYSQKAPTYPASFTNLALNNMNNANTPNLNWMNMYPLDAQTQEAKQPNINYRNLAMFQNKWTNIMSGLMSMGTNSNAEMMGAQFQMAALGMMADSNYIFAPNQMQYQQYPQYQQNQNYQNNISENQQYNENDTMATSGALTDNSNDQQVVTNTDKDTKTEKKLKTDESKESKDTKQPKKTIAHHHHKKHIKRGTKAVKSCKKTAPKKDDEKAKLLDLIPKDDVVTTPKFKLSDLKVKEEKYIAVPDKTRVANPYKLKAQLLSEKINSTED